MDAVWLYVAMAEPQLSEQYLYQPTQSYSRVAGLAGVEEMIALAQEYVDDPNAAVRAAVDEVAEDRGWSVDFRDGFWFVSAGQAVPRVVAGRIATVIGDYDKTCGVLVDTDRGKCALLRDGQTLAIAEGNCWKVTRMPSSLSTPSSQLSEGPLRGEAFSLTNPPTTVTSLANQIGIELEHVRQFL